MDAERFDAGPEHAHAHPMRTKGGLLRHVLWSVFTAVPGLSSVAWFLLAVRTGRGRYLLNAVLYLIWPVVGLFFAGMFIGVAGLESSTENQTAFVSLVCAGMWLASLVNAHREWKSMTPAAPIDATGDTSSEWPPLPGEPDHASIAAPFQTHASLAGADDGSMWMEEFYEPEHPEPAETTPGDGRLIHNHKQQSQGPTAGGPGLYILCYGLWLTLGWVGAHRFYCGRWVSGLFYACSFGFAGAGWAADLFLLNSMIDDLRRKERKQRDTSTAGRATARATWSESDSRFAWFDFVLRLGFFLVGPFVFTLLCILCKHYELLAVMFVVVVVCGLLGNIESALSHMTALEKVPLLGGALHVFRDMYAYYLTHKPRSFLFYLCYPVTAPVAAVVSPRAREELRLYWRMLRPILAVIAAQQILTYSSIYPPHLGPQEAFVRIFVLSIFAAFSTTVFLVPMVTTSFALNLSGRQSQLKFLTILCLAFALPTGIYCYYEQTQQISFLASNLLEERMDKSSFRDELHESAEMFLGYHVDRVSNPQTAAIAEHPELTERFRRHIGGIAVEDEANGFVVFTVPGEQHTPDDVWLGVRVWYGYNDEPSDILFLMSPHKELYTHWGDLPASLQRNFRVMGDDWDHYEEDVSERPEVIAAQTLIRDLY